jgi:NAD-dependent SIR2 family protein deacetylase
MKNSKKLTHNLARDYNKVKKALINLENKLEHFPALRKLIDNFEKKYGVSSEPSRILNLLYRQIKKLKSRKN